MLFFHVKAAIAFCILSSISPPPDCAYLLANPFVNVRDREHHKQDILVSFPIQISIKFVRISRHETQ